MNETCFAGDTVHISDTRWCIAQIMISTCLFESPSILPHEVVSMSIKRNMLKMVAESGNDETMCLVKV